MGLPPLSGGALNRTPNEIRERIWQLVLGIPDTKPQGRRVELRVELSQVNLIRNRPYPRTPIDVTFRYSTPDPGLFTAVFLRTLRNCRSLDESSNAEIQGILRRNPHTRGLSYIQGPRRNRGDAPRIYFHPQRDTIFMTVSSMMNMRLQIGNEYVQPGGRTVLQRFTGLEKVTNLEFPQIIDDPILGNQQYLQAYRYFFPTSLLPAEVQPAGNYQPAAPRPWPDYDPEAGDPDSGDNDDRDRVPPTVPPYFPNAQTVAFSEPRSTPVAVVNHFTALRNILLRRRPPGQRPDYLPNGDPNASLMIEQMITQIEYTVDTYFRTLLP